MTVTKICGISDLETALVALEAEADLLGFVFAPSRRRVEPEASAAIIERCRVRFPPAQRPWKAVGVFVNAGLAPVRTTAAVCDLDVVQLSGSEPAEQCRELGLPVLKAVHVPALLGRTADAAGDESRRHIWRGAARIPGIPDLLDSLRAQYAPARLVLDSGGPGCWGGAGEAFPWRLIGSARDCLVAGGLDPGNVGRAIAAMRPWGVDVSSGVESGGAKDPWLIRQFIAAVREADESAD